MSDTIAFVSVCVCVCVCVCVRACACMHACVCVSDLPKFLPYCGPVGVVVPL